MTDQLVKTSSVSRPSAHAWLNRAFGPLIALIRLFTGRRRAKTEEIVVYSVHQSFFLWALILGGFIGAVCVRHWPDTSVVWGWIYLWLMLYSLVTLIYDVNTSKFMLWIGIFGFIWLAAAYMQNLKQVPVLSNVLEYFHEQRPELSPGFATAISWLLLPTWIGSICHTFTQGRTTFTPNSVETVNLGEGNEIIDRSGLKFRRRYRDLFETILGMGACDLEATDGNGNVVKRWENILFLAFTWNRLDEILHQRATVFESNEKPARPAE